MLTILMSMCEDKCSEMTDEKRGTPGEIPSVISRMLAR